MQNKIHAHNSIFTVKTSNRVNFKNLEIDSNNVDINTLLNRVKIIKNQEKKKNIILTMSTISSLSLLAYIIFN